MPDPQDTDTTGSGWRRRGACRDADPEMFFPVGNSGLALMQEQMAKEVCRSCPVTATCLEWALTVGEIGVWGGTTDEERRRLPLRRRRALVDAAGVA